jgi:hypothetical protein
MLTKQQCALLKTVPTKQQVVGKPPTKPKEVEVEVEVTMQSAFNQFSLTIYKQHKE